MFKTPILLDSEIKSDLNDNDNVLYMLQSLDLKCPSSEVVVVWLYAHHMGATTDW